MKHFNFLSNFRWFTTVILLITLSIGQMWGATVTINMSDSWAHTGTSGSGGTTDITKSGMTVSTAKGYKDGTNHVRVYKNTTLVVSSTAGNITKIQITSTASGTSDYGPSKISLKSGLSGSYSYSGSVGTWSYASGLTSVTFNANAQFRFTQVVVTYAASTVSKTSITGLNYNYGSGPSAAQTFTVGGTHVTGNLTVTAPTNFEVSTSSGSGYGSSVTLTPTSGTVSTTTIYVRLASGKAVGTYGSASTYVTVSGGGTTTKNVSVSGTVAAAASCSVNPTAGSASLNGSISLSSLPVQTTGWTVGTNCSWSDFGFVWSTSVSSPTLESNGTASTNCTKIQKATSGTATSTSHSITGTFSVGASYYVRGYGKNGYASGTYQYTDVLTITPRSITFNSNGGSSVSTIYVNSGTAASAPTAPTKTGYTFGGWYTDNGTFASAVNWSSTISENKTYYAKWTAKTTTISFNQNSGTGGQTGTLTATYDAAMPSAPVTCPTRTGYDFGGYYDGSGGTGTQYYTSTGASARTWNKENATWTLYAKWTIKTYSVTWKVNNANYTTGGPTDNVNHGSKVTKLPTAPDPASYCGSKFMGWTDATDGAYVHGTSNLYTAASQFPAAEGAQVFYAVFADYVAP